MTFTADEAVEPGGCHVASSTGTVEAQLRAQWEALSNALLQAKGNPA
jgi:flagellar biosynthesis/type III secretory pathway protein FliH